jgi:hypothetical protein
MQSREPPASYAAGGEAVRALYSSRQSLERDGGKGQVLPEGDRVRFGAVEGKGERRRKHRRERLHRWTPGRRKRSGRSEGWMFWRRKSTLWLIVWGILGRHGCAISARPRR